MSLQRGVITIGLREANQRFSEAIRIVKSGREVMLTERGKPIAVIKPLRTGKNVERILRAMENEGLLQQAASVKLSDFIPIKIKGKPLSETVKEDRD